MASDDMFDLTIIGKGGHGAYPHLCIDPIVAASSIILNLQTVVSRKINAADSAVITIGSINGGSMHNIIPEKVTLRGTARSLRLEVRNVIPDLIEQTVRGVCESVGAEYEFDFMYSYPPTINSAVTNQIVINAAHKVLGDDSVISLLHSSMAADDFAFFAEWLPSTYFHLGCRNEKKCAAETLHSPNFTIDEDALELGCALVTQIAFDNQ